MGKFGTQGTGRGQLNSPSGIATDIYGFILVTDWGNHPISIFNKDGVIVHNFGSHGDGFGQTTFPRQIAISFTGDIYVCDTNNKRIQVFSLNIAQ